MNRASVLKVLEAGYVRRCHTTPSDVTHTVGHHSWGVAVILQYINPDCSKAAILAALYHDVPEVETGDIPAPAKWASRQLSEALTKLEIDIEHQLDIFIDLAPDEIEAVKLADSIDLLLFARHRVFMGDRYFEGYERRLLDYLAPKTAIINRYPNAKGLIYAP